MNRLLVLVLGLTTLSLAAVPLPPPLETGHLLGKGLPAGEPPVKLTDEFYALAWSRANAFAYLERRHVSDAVRVRLRVLDTVDDAILFEREWPAWAEGERDSWWVAREKEVSEVFTRFNLVSTDRQLGVFPAIVDNEFYTLALRTSRFDATWINRLEIVAHSTGRGLKTVGTVTGYWRWASLLGFLPSPFENRVAVVLLVQPSGWDGPRQPLRFLVSGLSLKAGFAKP